MVPTIPARFKPTNTIQSAVANKRTSSHDVMNRPATTPLTARSNANQPKCSRNPNLAQLCVSSTSRTSKASGGGLVLTACGRLDWPGQRNSFTRRPILKSHLLFLLRNRYVRFTALHPATEIFIRHVYFLSQSHCAH